ncbi:hypothetical protein PoB_003981100 [Plakobranchus ocellatus]|uniref:Potassium channel domain-containing protein n=1 Tax=Plakobranchus ocellatus TaxID=259542 RepID=A0AAV4B398_9GAST|nr:hypothetical protein PoB_003981100 [Plakobranchus ocellatus]
MPPPGYVTCQPNATTTDAANIGQDDLNALLYIVVTLLFYSMGIVIGIITYLKREQAEMEEDKMFEVYLHMKREPFNLHKQERVNQMALYLKQLEDQKTTQEKTCHWEGAGNEQHFYHQPACSHQHQHHHFHQHRDQLSGSQQCSDSQKMQPSPGPCSVCQPSQAFSDCQTHSHLHPHHIQTLPYRSHNNAERDNPAGTPALLCSLTLNVCEPFLTPETLPKAALPFRPPSPRCGMSNPMNKIQMVMDDTESSKSRCCTGETSSEKVTYSSSPSEKTNVYISTDMGSLGAEKFFPRDKYKKEVGLEISCSSTEKSIELQQLGDEINSSMETSPDIFPQHQKVSPPLAEAQSNFKDERAKYSSPFHTSKSLIAPSLSSPPLYTRSVSSDQTMTCTGKNRLQRQLSLHQDRSFSAAHGPATLSNLHTETLQEKSSIAAAQIMSGPSESKSTDLECDDQKSLKLLSQSRNDNNLNSEQVDEEHAPSSSLSVSHSDPLLPQKDLIPSHSSSSTRPKRPLDARPKIYNVLGGSDSGDTGLNLSSTSADHGIGKQRKSLVDAWRRNNAQSVDIPELSRQLRKDEIINQSPELFRSKALQIQSQGTRSTFPRVPTSRDERRGALFLSQKSLLQASGSASKIGVSNRTGRLSRANRGVLSHQESVDFPSMTTAYSENSDTPLLEPVILDVLHPSVQNTAERDTVSPVISSASISQGGQSSRIPKLSRAKTLDPSSLQEK